MTPSARFIAALAACAIAHIAHAAGVKFDIPTQQASTALVAFGKQASVEVSFAFDDLKGIQANPVQGEMEPSDALTALLKGTGFAAKQTSATNFQISAVIKPGSIDGIVRTTENYRAVPGAKVAILGTDKFVLTDRRGRFTIEEVPAGSHALIITAEGMQRARVTDVTVSSGRQLTLSPIQVPAQVPGVIKMEDFIVSAKKNDGVIELDRYDVEGLREKPFVSGNMDIPRTISDVQPYYIFEAKTIDASGAVNVEDFLKQRLTMNTVARTTGEISGSGSNAGNNSSIDLRGLGIDKTLVLVNGRRMAGVTVQATGYQPDLNGIPVGSVERIEVLPSSASGIYGGSAIGGVVNIILKKNYTGGELRTTYDNTWDTDSPRRAASFSYGLALEEGKTHISFNASWSDDEPLLLQDRRDLFERNLAILRHNSSGFTFGSTPWLGRLPNIMPLSGTQATLTLKNGVSLNSRYTHIPEGTSFTTSTAQLYAGLLANAGQWDLGVPATAQASGLSRPFGSSPEVKSVSASVRRKMLPQVELFADFSYNDNSSTSIFTPIATRTVAANVPSNPFTTTIFISQPHPYQSPITNRSVLRSATMGAIVQLPWRWTGALDYTWSENRFASFYYESDSATADVASGVLNPFVDTLLYPFDLPKYLTPISYGGTTQLQDATLRASGPLDVLPWGVSTLTMGLEHRIARNPERTLTQDYDITTENSRIIRFYDRESITDSAYTELTLPLFKQGFMNGLHALDLQLSGRSERYEVDGGTPSEFVYFERTPPLSGYTAPTKGGQPFTSRATYTSHNYTVGIRYQPIPGITLRVSRASAFLPPSPSQLIKNADQNPATTPVNDPKTSQAGVQVFTLSGGNPDLKPQSSKSFNAGLIWEPSAGFLTGLRLNLEYYRIEQFDAISNLGAQAIVDQESLYPERVIRDNNGRITLVDISAVNLYHLDSEGWDLSGYYELKTTAGRFNFRATGSLISHLKEQYSFEQPKSDAAGYHYSEGGSPKYKANATLTWENRRWSAGWTARYFGSYKMYGAAGGPLSVRNVGGRVYSTVYIEPQGSDSVSSQIYHDLFLGYAFGARSARPNPGISDIGAKVLDSLTIQLGVRNILNKAAPLDAGSSSSNYYLSPYGDARLRTYWISIKKSL